MSVGCSLGVFWFLGFLCCSLHFSFSLLGLLRFLYWSLGSSFTWNRNVSIKYPVHVGKKHQPFFSPLGCDALEGAMLVVVLSSSSDSSLHSSRRLSPPAGRVLRKSREERRGSAVTAHRCSWVEQEHPVPYNSVLKISKTNHTNYAEI